MIDHLHERVQTRADHGRGCPQFRSIARAQRMIAQAVPVLEQEQATFLDLGWRTLGRTVADFACGHGQVQRVIGDDRLFHVPDRVGQGQEHAVGPSALQRFQCVVTGLFAQLQQQVGPFAPQPWQQARQEKGRDGGNDAHPQLTGERFTRCLDEIGQFLGLAQHPMRLGDHVIAERGKAHHPAAAFHQRHIEQRFQFANAGRKRGLRNEGGFRRATEMPVFVQRHEILQLFERGQISGHPVRPSRGSLARASLRRRPRPGASSSADPCAR